MTPTASPYLSLGYAPQRTEFDVPDLRIEGRLPDDLVGTFYRVGPNPQFPPREPYNPLNGDGMVHAFRIADGRVSYRNRWVRTAKWTLENAAGVALFGTTGAPGDDDPSVRGVAVNGSANTNLVFHAGRLLALEEGHGPIEIDPVTLETLGDWTFRGRLPRNMTAHPKIDPDTGEMVLIANFEDPRAGEVVAVHTVDAAGDLVRSAQIAGPYRAIVHDFAITPRFVIVAFCPSTVSLKRAMAGGPLLAWEPDLPMQVAVMPRTGSGADARWWRGPPMMIWHTLNAFEDGARVIVDVCQQDSAMFPGPDGTAPVEALAVQRLARLSLDWDAPGELAWEVLWEGPCEYPRVDDALTGRRHRCGFLACDGGPGSGDLFQRGLARFDVETRTLDRWAAGPGFAVAEPVPCGAYVLTNVFDEEKDASHLAILHADRLAAGPIARAHLDHRVPVGFHGLWIGAD
jgi:carotenoid cleavage dioxygenase